MLDCDATSVQEYEHYNAPIEGLRLDSSSYASSNLLFHNPEGLASTLALKPGMDVAGPIKSCSEIKIISNQKRLWFMARRVRGSGSIE